MVATKLAVVGVLLMVGELLMPPPVSAGCSSLASGDAPLLTMVVGSASDRRAAWDDQDRRGDVGRRSASKLTLAVGGSQGSLDGTSGGIGSDGSGDLGSREEMAGGRESGEKGLELEGLIPVTGAIRWA